MVEIDAEPDVLLTPTRCAHSRCPHDARPNGIKSKKAAFCRDHHAQAMQDWRARRRAAGKSIAGASPTAPSSSAEAVRVRVALSRAIARGVTQRGACVDCGARKGVVAVRRPGEPNLWACRACRAGILRDKAEVRAQREREAARVAEAARLAATRRTALELLAAAPAEIQAELHAIVAAMAFGPIRLQPGSPLYQQRLAQLAESRLRAE